MFCGFRRRLTYLIIVLAFVSGNFADVFAGRFDDAPSTLLVTAGQSDVLKQALSVKTDI